jgi:hypothetical protein
MHTKGYLLVRNRKFTSKSVGYHYTRDFAIYSLRLIKNFSFVLFIYLNNFHFRIPI